MSARAFQVKAILGSFAAALVWGMLMTVTVAAGLALRGRIETFHLPTILLIAFCGGGLGWLLAEGSGRLLFAVDSLRRFTGKTAVRATIAVGSLAAATIVMTAGLFALEYRSFYAQWHAPALSRVWLLQFAFTSASAFYQFAIMALRLYLPLGPVFLAGGAWTMLRRMR